MGASSYHPRMYLKVLIYGCLENCYSSRKLEKAIQENIGFMGLSDMQRPDHNTVNRFRGKKICEVIRKVFSQVELMLYDEGLLDIKDVYTAGSKIMTNANRCIFFWGKAVKKSRERIESSLRSSGIAPQKWQRKNSSLQPFVVNYTLHQKPNGTTALIPHMNAYRQMYAV